jgi:hypothetical protein
VGGKAFAVYLLKLIVAEWLMVGRNIFDEPICIKNGKGREQGVEGSLLTTGERRRRLCAQSQCSAYEESLGCLLGAIQSSEDTVSNLTLSFRSGVHFRGYELIDGYGIRLRDQILALLGSSPSENDAGYAQTDMRLHDQQKGREDTLCFTRGIGSTLLASRTLTAT